MKNLIRKILREEYEWYDAIVNDFDPSPAAKWLFNLMKSLTITPSKQNPGLMLYRNSEGENLMVDTIDRNDKNPILYVSYQEIWSKLSEEFGLNHQEIKDLCKRMLEMTHKRKVFTTLSQNTIRNSLLEMTHKRKVFTTMFRLS